MKITSSHTVALAATASLMLLLLAKMYADSPGLLIFSADGTGRGQGAILHAGTAWNADVARPAKAGEALELYLAEPRESLPECPTAEVCAATSLAVLIGGAPAPMLFSGRAPGVRGKHQINVLVPAGVEPGPQVAVLVRSGGTQSNQVTISLR